MNRFFMPLKNNARVFGLLVCLFMGLAGGLLTGCDGGDSYESRLEDARMALDNGHYALAKSILDSLPQTQEVLQYKSNALAGGVLGLNTLDIISTLADLDKAGNAGSIDMVGLIIAGEDGQLTADEITTKLGAATEAIELFKTIAAMNNDGSKGNNDFDYLTSDQKMQLGLLAITRTVLTLADMLCEAIGDSVTMTEAWIHDNLTPVAPSQAEIDLIGEDLVLIGYAIEVFADTNDMKDDFEHFKSDLDGNNDDEITAGEINAYLGTM